MHRRKCTSQLRTGAAPGPACGVALVTPASHQQPSTSVESLSARPSPGLHWPRVTFAGRLRGDKAPDVLVEALALPHVPPPTAGRPALGPVQAAWPTAGGSVRAADPLQQHLRRA